MNALEVEDFIMTNELNWNLAGNKFSAGIMQNFSTWQKWKNTRQSPVCKAYIEKTVRMNNPGGLFYKMKELVQADPKREGWPECSYKKS
jgi:hypothetical protein